CTSTQSPGVTSSSIPRCTKRGVPAISTCAIRCAASTISVTFPGIARHMLSSLSIATADLLTTSACGTHLFDLQFFDEDLVTPNNVHIPRTTERAWVNP